MEYPPVNTTKYRYLQGGWIIGGVLNLQYSVDSKVSCFNAVSRTILAETSQYKQLQLDSKYREYVHLVTH